MQLGGPLAGSQDHACVGVLDVASERGKLHALLIDCHNVDLEDGACAELEIGHSPFYGPLPSCFVVCVNLGGSNLDARDPAHHRVRIPDHEYRPLWPVSKNKALIEAGGQVLLLLGRRLDHKQAFFLWPAPWGPEPKPPPPPLWPCRPKGPTRGRSIERLRCGCTSGSVHLGSKNVQSRCWLGQST